MHIYDVGDTIPGVGVVEINHCGLPYVAGLDGLYYGVCQVSGHDAKGNSIFCDMKTGKVLSKYLLRKRLNNRKYDYKNTWGNCDTLCSAVTCTKRSRASRQEVDCYRSLYGNLTDLVDHYQ